MKVLFVGPSLAGASLEAIVGREAARGIVRRGPARQGDVARAVAEGASAIGLVDGLYETIAAVWHKEILHAVSEGVTVLGGASIGALRAAECAPFGMIGVGAIYRRYASGELDDDAAVAQLHAPAELDFFPLTEALVNAEATIDRLLAEGLVAPQEAALLRACAAGLYFKERTFERIAEALPEPQRRAAIGEALATRRVDLKRSDASDLVVHLARLPDVRTPMAGFELSRTQMLLQVVAQSKRLLGAPPSS